MKYAFLVLWTVQNLYPELVEIDMQKETRDFYYKLYNFQLTDEQVQNMLDGKLDRQPFNR